MIKIMVFLSRRHTPPSPLKTFFEPRPQPREMGPLLEISRFLSYTVIGMSLFMKIPQIRALFVSSSTEGINLRTNWMEIGAYLIGLSYGYTHEYHVSIYFESGVLAIQNGVIIFLVIFKENRWTLENGFYTLLSVLFVAATYLKVVPHYLLSILLSSTLPLAAAGKLAQIATIYRLKSKGSVSVMTWALTTYGCAARLFTVYVEVGDMEIFFNFFVSFILNGIVVMMCIYYGNKKIE